MAALGWYAVMKRAKFTHKPRVGALTRVYGMPMETGERVALRSDKSWTGRVASPEEDGVVSVDGDDGGRPGVCRWTRVDVVAEDKSWPPKGMETK